MSCMARFGMVTMETEVEELLSLVMSTGREIDESVAQLQTMSEVRGQVSSYTLRKVCTSWRDGGYLLTPTFCNSELNF